MATHVLGVTMNWLLHGQCQSIIDAKLDCSLSDLTAFLDCQLGDSDDNLCIGLELHYDRANHVDLSIYCGQPIPSLAAGKYPQRLGLWQTFVNQRGLARLFPQKFWLEYDYYPSGYQLSGLFQRCNEDCRDITKVANLLAEYSSLARGNKPCNGSVQPDWLQQLFADFGLPQWIGLMERGQGLIKFVFALNPVTVCKLKHFIDENFGTLLITLGLDSSIICNAVERWLRIATVRISVDYDPRSNALADRLCFELMIPSDRILNESELCTLRQIELNFKASAEQVMRSTSILHKLPYFATQPAFNLIDRELFMLAFNHAKICLNMNAITVKDYLLAKRESLSNTAIKC